MAPRENLKVRADTTAPAFGHEHGFLYPLFWHFLALNRVFSPSMWFPRNSVLWIDLYLVLWWGAEAVYVTVLTSWGSWRGALLCCLLALRIIDMLFVHLSILTKGFYRRAEWSSPSRVVLLSLLNALELFFIYGVAYWALCHLFPQACSFEPAMARLDEAICFSVVTGTTLGYGTPHPTGWLSQLLTAVESLHVLLVLIALIAYARSVRPEPHSPGDTNKAEP